MSSIFELIEARTPSFLRQHSKTKNEEKKVPELPDCIRIIFYLFFASSPAQHSFMSVGAKRLFLQLNYCKNLYHQSRRENMKITVNIKV